MENIYLDNNLNRQYKNDLFVFLFGQNKEFALSLFNAMNNTSYDDPNEIVFNTIDNFVYISRKNDVSFLIENTMNIFEHQSTMNSNIAFRMFLYVSKLYEKYIYENKMDLFSSKLLKLPNPNFIVFYNGKQKTKDDRYVYLSDNMAIKNSNIELKVRIINTNYGHNMHILNKCPALYEYSWFVDKLRNKRIFYENNHDEQGLSRILDEVLDEMPDSFVIKDILMKNKAEVKDMLYSIEDEPRMMKIHEEEIRNEGIIIGKKEGKKEGIKEGEQSYKEKLFAKFLNEGYTKEEAEKLVEL